MTPDEHTPAPALEGSVAPPPVPASHADFGRAELAVVEIARAIIARRRGEQAEAA
jgi:hypothetical protein